jgi:hypothetical protein
VPADRRRGLEEHQDPIGRQERSPKQHHLLVDLDTDLRREPQDCFDHPLVEEREREPRIMPA